MSTGKWGVIIDAGSSGTRAFIYKWQDDLSHDAHQPTGDLASLPEVSLAKVKKARPGISTFASQPHDVGDYLQPLIDTATSQIPANKIPDTPIFVMATAGMRLVEETQRVALLDEVCAYLRHNTRFRLSDCSRHVQVISGETEGLYGWLAANYLLGGFDHALESAGVTGQDTFGFLDMGGASTQIVFVPNATEAAEHWDDLKLVRLRNVDGSPNEYRVFSTSFLGFGANAARERFVEALQERYSTVDMAFLPDPCMPNGLRKTIEGSPVNSDILPGDTILEGTGDFEECLRQTFPLLRKDAPCEDTPCLFNGQHTPAIDFDATRFVGVSEYWHVTHGVFSSPGNKPYDLASYREKVDHFCNQSWSTIQQGFSPRKKDSAQKVQDAQEACFKASWLISVLYEGIGVPMTAPDTSHASQPNISDGTSSSFDDGAIDPFLPVNKIHGVEFSWTLGTMLLHASTQIPSTGTSLPVGFGSAGDGIAVDFDHSGKPLKSYPTGEADTPPGNMHGRSSFGIFALMLMGIVLLVLLVCGRDRRGSLVRRLVPNSRRGRRLGGASVINWIVGFSRKLVTRESATYERVLEEGSRGEPSFLDIDGDNSDDSTPQETPFSHSLRTFKDSNGRSGEQTAHASIDRSGLVVRTESRDGLARAPQTQNVERRSRAGSPVR